MHEASICDFDGLCEININTRHVCPACRLTKCFQCGMTTDKLQLPRYNKPKTNALVKKQVRYQPTKLPTLNLLSSDQSLLTTDQWTLLRNLFNCYQESHILPFSQRLIDAHDVAQSNYMIYPILVDEFLASIYKTAEMYLCSNDDLRKLSSDNRYIILHSAAHNVCCMGAAFIVVHCRLNLLDSFLNALTIKFGKPAVDIHAWAKKFIDPDIVLVKLQRLIDAHDVAQSNYMIYPTLVDEFLASIYKTAEIYLCSNDDLRKLSSDNRYIILHSAAHNVCCMGAAFIVVHCRLNLLDSFLNALTIKFGKPAVDIHAWAKKFIDPDIVLVKLSISLFAFSENTGCYYSNTSNELTNSIDILEIQNKYAEIAWKYLLYKYSYYDAVKRFLNITLWLSSMTIFAVHGQSLPLYVNNIDAIIEHTEMTLILDEVDQIIETNQ
ncbi:unnamed protein product [Rotaria sp. Silwood1]|nr:unnamed protein product [Rotaria sp. Silwood1]